MHILLLARGIAVLIPGYCCSYNSEQYYLPFICVFIALETQAFLDKGFNVRSIVVEVVTFFVEEYPQEE